MSCITGALWTCTDQRTLRVSYASGGLASARAALPARSASAIYHRAKVLGVKRRRRWTMREDATLRREWHSSGLKNIASSLSRSVDATYWRAYELGLRCACPQGYEYLSTAADRCGYTPTQLRRILRWAGIVMRPVRGRRGEVSKRARHLLEIGDADDAVAKWISVGTSVVPSKTMMRVA